MAGLEPATGLFEKRPAGQLPIARTCRIREPAQVAAYAQDWEKYYTDHFGLRKLLLAATGWPLLSVWISPISAVVVASQMASRAGSTSTRRGGGWHGIRCLSGEKAVHTTKLARDQSKLPACRPSAGNHIEFLGGRCPDSRPSIQSTAKTDGQCRGSHPNRADVEYRPSRSGLALRSICVRPSSSNAEAGPISTPTRIGRKGIFVAFLALMHALQHEAQPRVLSSSGCQVAGPGPVQPGLIWNCWYPWYPRDSAVAPILAKHPSGGRRGKVLVFHDPSSFP